MNFFLDAFNNFLSKVLIQPNDLEVVKAKKIIWYAFFGSIGIIIIISWLIFVTFTFTANNVKVPNLKNDSIYVAIGKLSDKYLVADANPKYSEIYNEGTVFDQNPKPGSIVKKGRLVSFSVSLGQPQTSLPDFRGLTLFELVDYFEERYPNIKIPFKINAPIYEFS
jgi:serine/threonine-protein kinase